MIDRLELEQVLYSLVRGLKFQIDDKELLKLVSVGKDPHDLRIFLKKRKYPEYVHLVDIACNRVAMVRKYRIKGTLPVTEDNLNRLSLLYMQDEVGDVITETMIASELIYGTYECITRRCCVGGGSECLGELASCINTRGELPYYQWVKAVLDTTGMEFTDEPLKEFEDNAKRFEQIHEEMYAAMDKIDSAVDVAEPAAVVSEDIMTGIQDTALGRMEETATEYCKSIHANIADVKAALRAVGAQTDEAIYRGIPVMCSMLASIPDPLCVLAYNDALIAAYGDGDMRWPV